MLHLGLLITKDDDEIIGDWFRQNAHYFDAIVCLDGSESDVARIEATTKPKVVYIHERDCPNVIRTDHGLRQLAHRVLLDRRGQEGWITICHADEFFYHNPRKCCEAAEAAGFDGICWYALHFLPHLRDLPRRHTLNELPAHLRFRHYHWDYEGTGIPWLEFRSFRNHPGIHWNPLSHGSPEPIGCERISDFHPAYLHFKVFTLDPAYYANELVYCGIIE